MQECWQLDPTARPTFASIYEKLNKIMDTERAGSAASRVLDTQTTARVERPPQSTVEFVQGEEEIYYKKMEAEEELYHSSK